MTELVRVLERFVKRAPGAAAAARCEVCGATLEARHPHLVRLAPRGLVCACPTCAALFSAAASSAPFRTVPDRVLVDPEAAWSEADLAALGVPVGLAFVVMDSSRREPVAFYPSPAGPIEAAVPLEAWRAAAARSELLARLAPDVEAIVFHRPLGGPVECYLAPVDVCYELVGAVRTRWKGFDGGDDARAAIAEVFAGLRRRAEALTTRDGAKRHADQRRDEP